MADNFTFFTLVRDPVRRFGSSYAQALKCVSNLDPTGNQYQTCQKVRHQNVSTMSAMLTIMEVREQLSNRACHGCARRVCGVPMTIVQEAPARAIKLFVASLHAADADAVRVWLGYQNGKFPNEHFQSQFWRTTPSLHNGSRAPLHYIGRLEHWQDDLTELFDMVVAKDPEFYAKEEQRMKLALLKHHLFGVHSNHHSMSDLVNKELIEPSPSLRKRSARPPRRREIWDAKDTCSNVGLPSFTPSLFPSRVCCRNV